MNEESHSIRLILNSLEEKGAVSRWFSKNHCETAPLRYLPDFTRASLSSLSLAHSLTTMLCRIDPELLHDTHPKTFSVAQIEQSHPDGA